MGLESLQNVIILTTLGKLAHSHQHTATHTSLCPHWSRSWHTGTSTVADGLLQDYSFGLLDCMLKDLSFCRVSKCNIMSDTEIVIYVEKSQKCFIQPRLPGGINSSVLRCHADKYIFFWSTWDLYFLQLFPFVVISLWVSTSAHFPSAADFGFARYLQSNTMAATLCGSPMYMVSTLCRLCRDGMENKGQHMQRFCLRKYRFTDFYVFTLKTATNKKRILWRCYSSIQTL